MTHSDDDEKFSIYIFVQLLQKIDAALRSWPLRFDWSNGNDEINVENVSLFVYPMKRIGTWIDSKAWRVISSLIGIIEIWTRNVRWKTKTERKSNSMFTVFNARSRVNFNFSSLWGSRVTERCNRSFAASSLIPGRVSIVLWPKKRKSFHFHLSKFIENVLTFSSLFPLSNPLNKFQISFENVSTVNQFFVRWISRSFLRKPWIEATHR